MTAQFRRWALLVIRILAFVGFAASLWFAWDFFAVGVIYGKLAYSVPKPNPIYIEVAGNVSRAVKGYLLLSILFFLIFLFTFFTCRKQK